LPVTAHPGNHFGAIHFSFYGSHPASIPKPLLGTGEGPLNNGAVLSQRADPTPAVKDMKCRMLWRRSKAQPHPRRHVKGGEGGGSALSSISTALSEMTPLHKSCTMLEVSLCQVSTM